MGTNANQLDRRLLVVHHPADRPVGLPAHLAGQANNFREKSSHFGRSFFNGLELSWHDALNRQSVAEIAAWEREISSLLAVNHQPVEIEHQF